MLKDLSNQEYAELISKVVTFLKDKKINQNIIEDRIKYYSLSKAKNHKKYPQQIIEGKNRYEVLTAILESYGLAYEIEKNEFYAKEGDFDKTTFEDSTIYYVLYYFSLAKQIVGKGLVIIQDKKWATIDFCDPNHTPAIWRGNFEVIENFTFLYVEKKENTTPVKALYSFFSGTIKLGRPILIGTYSTIKRDGSPTAGNIVMEKAEIKEDGIKKIMNDTDPKITAFLLGKNFTLKTLTPPTISNLPKSLIDSSYVGDFSFYWPYKNDRILIGKLTIKENTEVIASFENLYFKGHGSLSDHNSLYLQLRNSIVKGNSKNNDIHVFLNINNYNNKDGVIAGIVNTPSLFTSPSAFPILIVKDKDKFSKETIQEYFKSFTGPLLSCQEPLELISTLEVLQQNIV